MIPISKPLIGIRERRAVNRVLKSGKLTQGPEVAAFEIEFGKLLAGERPIVAVNSGTSGLHLALLASGVGRGDEVILPSFTFAASANAVVLTGAKPVFCDIRPDTFTLDHELLRSLVTDRTRLIMPVHLFGHPAQMTEIMTFANSQGLRVIEDAAQAHAASIKGRAAGTFGDFGVFSLYPSKNMTSGEGGMVACSSPDSASKIRLLRNQGMEEPYRNEIVGLNNRMSDIHAAIGRVQLRKLEAWTAKRRLNAEFLTTELRGVATPIESPDYKHVYHQYVVRVPVDRNGFAAALLREHKIGSGIYYPIPAHKLRSLEAYARGAHLPFTDVAAGEVLALPVHPALTKRQLEHIAKAVNSVAQAGA